MNFLRNLAKENATEDAKYINMSDQDLNWYYGSFGYDHYTDDMLLEEARTMAMSWGIPAVFGGGAQESLIVMELCKRIDEKNK